jgi:hypothetical protein
VASLKETVDYVDVVKRQHYMSVMSQNSESFNRKGATKCCADTQLQQILSKKVKKIFERDFQRIFLYMCSISSASLSSLASS